jgi:hypothetical protein
MWNFIAQLICENFIRQTLFAPAACFRARVGILGGRGQRSKSGLRALAALTRRRKVWIELQRLPRRLGLALARQYPASHAQA